MAKVAREDYINSRYKQLMKNKKGRRLIQVLRLLSKGMMTNKVIEQETGFSQSGIGMLIKTGIKEGLVVGYSRKGPIHLPPGGQPEMRKTRRKTGRPEHYYALTGEGKWLMRFDPEVRDKWDQLGVKYEGIVEHTEFDSYLDFVFATRKNPTLKKYRKPYYYMDHELQRTVLNPFLFPSFLKKEDKEELYDELVKVMKQSVAPEHVIGYYRTLETAISELEKILERHKLLVEKMEVLEEVRKYKS